MLTYSICEDLSRESVPLFLSPVKAGFPSPASDFEDDELDFNRLLVKRKASTYCLRVSGDSMIGAGIDSNDILVVDRSLTPLNGDIVVAAVDGEFTVKRFFKRVDSIVLRAENGAYPDFIYQSDREVDLFGVVTSVIKQFKRY